MPQFLVTWLLTALALVVTVYIVPGLALPGGFAAALIAAIVLGFVNSTVRPILVVLTFPITIVSLGLFLFVINAIGILLVGYFSPGLTVDGFLPALVGSIVLSIVSGILNNLAGQDAKSN
ncbi:MAG: phage holin family protein [Cyanobacteria bacterium SID2]|nr:phage holin family protein [Cyanobacteria bacterium SID2]MBP0003594.1 phage holin family protein [Cyanobacteria bacterium SBC]